MSDPAARVFDPGPQSGARRPAPGRLGLVQAFVNTHFDIVDAWGTDILATPESLARWLAARGLATPGAPPPPEAERRRAVAVREGLRALAATHNGAAHDARAIAALRAAARGLSAGVAVDADGSTRPTAASHDVAGALGLVLAVVHESTAAGTWPRLKVCPGHHCGWAFYDQSRNQAGTWCSMRVCGSREKARAYRRRSRADRE